MSLNATKNNIILSGGGTGGSVTPLIALAEEMELRHPGTYAFHWIGTDSGIERRLTSAYPFVYHSIAAGKLRRYFSVQNFLDWINIVIGFFQSLVLLHSLKPRIVMSAGGFVSVPLIWAARLMDVPVLVHQQDFRPGLANKLMAPFATAITTVFEKSVSDYGAKAQWIGNPMRQQIKAARGEAHSKPCLLVLGGGTGSQSINELITANLKDLLEFVDVVHITGKHNVRSALREDLPGYQSYDLLDGFHMAKAMVNADMVLTRAGLGTLSELSYLGKTTIIIPIPDSHQEDNANYFSEHKAAIVLNQKSLNNEVFVSLLRDLSSNQIKREELSHNIKQVMKQDANETMMEIVDKLLL